MRELEEILSRTATRAAKRLLGCNLIRSIDDQKIICKIVETEAYDQNDPASHSYHGITSRTEVMFGQPAHLYVYFTYGMHHCMNIVTGPNDYGSAVLIRALEPLSGIEVIRANRQGVTNRYMLTNGPGKACQALAIGREFNGHDLKKPPLMLEIMPEIKHSELAVSTRIGISQATDKRWRFYIKNNSYVSKASKSVNVI